MAFERVRKQYLGWLSPVYHGVNRATGGGLEILWRAVREFTQNGSPESAASLGFYAIFSLFPLLAVVVTGLSFIASEDQILQTLIQYLIPIFPVSRGLISENLQRFVELRGTFGVFGLLGIIWSASNVFIILVRNLNRAWETARARNFIHTRLVALALVGVMLGLLILAQIGSSVINIISHIQIPGFGGLEIGESFLGTLARGGLPSIITFIVFLLIYRYVPAATVRFREAFWGALVVTIFWDITSIIFAWYIDSGLSQFDLLYGSIATITVLMLWFYINSLILIYGAYVSSAIAQHQLERDTRLPVAAVKDEAPQTEISEFD